MTSMFMFGFLIVGLVFVLAAFSPKIYRKLKAKVYAVGDKVSKKLANPEEEAKLIIHEAEKDIINHKNNLVGLMTSLSSLERRLSDSKEEVAKWLKVATKAKEKGDVDDVKVALGRKLSAEKQVELLSADCNKTRETVTKIQEFIRLHEERLKNAKSNMVNLSARQQVVKLREDLLKGTVDSEGLAALSDLEEMVETAESEVDAKETVFGTDDLETKYTTINVDLDDKVAEFMNS